MKRERPEDLHHHHHHHHQPHHHSNGIFSSTPQFPLHPPPPPHPPSHLRRSSTSDDTDNSYDSSSKHPAIPPSSSDGATIEVVRRPRGRPPGSKNKPKAPTPTPLHPPDSSLSEPSMGPYILELPPGVDLVDSTARFCRRRNVGLCILSGHGVVSNVSLKQPSATPGATVSFHGRFDILSISATVVPAGGLPAGNGAFTLFLAGPQGQVVGGLVVGPLISAGTVYLIAATFDSPMFVRLQPAEVEEDAAENGCGGNHHRESPREETGGGGGGGIYSYQAADVIWAPTPRQPPAPPPPQY